MKKFNVGDLVMIIGLPGLLSTEDFEDGELPMGKVGKVVHHGFGNKCPSVSFKEHNDWAVLWFEDRDLRLATDEEILLHKLTL